MAPVRPGLVDGGDDLRRQEGTLDDGDNGRAEDDRDGLRRDERNGADVGSAQARSSTFWSGQAPKVGTPGGGGNPTPQRRAGVGAVMGATLALLVTPQIEAKLRTQLRNLADARRIRDGRELGRLREVDQDAA